MEYILENKNGMKVVLDSFGATIKDIIFDGDSVICQPPYAASVIGRVAGRISSGDTFMLHGNHEFDRNEWKGEQNDNTVKFTYSSPNGSNGFPGNVDVCVTYVLSDFDSIRISYFATTDKTTYFNMTNHAYFNLNGKKSEITDHILSANVSHYVPLKENLTPVGILEKVEGTIFDINEGKCLKDVVESTNSQVATAKNGYDHAFIFDDCKDYDLYTTDILHTATLECTTTNRVVTMLTDYPCFVCYSGNQMEKPHMGICLEAQLIPDAPNYDDFGSIDLLPEKAYEHFVEYKFWKK